MNVLETRSLPVGALCRERVLHDVLFARRDDVIVCDTTDPDCARRLLLACERHPTIRRFVYCSSGQVYRRTALEPNILDEDAPLDHTRAVADLVVAARIGISRLSIAVLRFADSWQMARAMRVRPLGFDPMVNLITGQDRAHALALAIRSDAPGIFNIPGADTLPLTHALSRTIALPFLFRLRFGGILDGTLARDELGYVACHLLRRGSCARMPSASASSPPATSLEPSTSNAT